MALVETIADHVYKCFPCVRAPLSMLHGYLVFLTAALGSRYSYPHFTNEKQVPRGQVAAQEHPS